MCNLILCYITLKFTHKHAYYYYIIRFRLFCRFWRYQFYKNWARTADLTKKKILAQYYYKKISNNSSQGGGQFNEEFGPPILGISGVVSFRPFSSAQTSDNAVIYVLGLSGTANTANATIFGSQDRGFKN